MSDISNILTKSLLPLIGQKGLNAIESELNDILEDTTTAWKRASLALIINAVELYGPRGLKLAQKALQDFLDGKEPELDWADLEVVSDFLVQLQNAEADNRAATRMFLVQVSSVLATVIEGIIKGLL